MNQHTVHRRWRRDYDRFMAAFGKTFGFGFHPGQQDTCQTYYSVFLLSSFRKVNCQIFVMYYPDRQAFQIFEFCTYMIYWVKSNRHKIYTYYFHKFQHLKHQKEFRYLHLRNSMLTSTNAYIDSCNQTWHGF